MECLSFCIANHIDLTRLDNHYKSTFTSYHTTKSRDVLKVNHNNADNIVFVFKNGTVVSWGIKRYQIQEHLQIIRNFADKPVTSLVHDEFSFQYSDKTVIEPHDYFDVDCMLLEQDNEEIKLAFSYGFSQSVKLQYFETILENLIEKYTPLIQNPSSQGKMSVSRNKILQVIGDILAAKSEMNLLSNFMYHPKFFWQHPTLEEYYTMLERYLHIQRRINAINHRLNTLTEIFEMFSDYLDSRHSHHLEVIIIVLIAIEIVFGVLNFHF